MTTFFKETARDSNRVIWLVFVISRVVDVTRPQTAAVINQ
jgi:hypothetical protein